MPRRSVLAALASALLATAAAQPATAARVSLDDAAPRVSIETARFRAGEGVARDFSLRTRFTARDSGTVAYTVTVSDGATALASRTGRTSSGHASALLRFCLPTAAKGVRLTIRAVDAQGNERSVTLRVRLGT